MFWDFMAWVMAICVFFGPEFAVRITRCLEEERKRSMAEPRVPLPKATIVRE